MNGFSVVFIPLIYSHFLNCSSVSHRVLKPLGSLCMLISYYLLHDAFTNMVPGQIVSFLGARFSMHSKSTFHHVWLPAVSCDCSPFYSWGEGGPTSSPTLVYLLHMQRLEDYDLICYPDWSEWQKDSSDVYLDRQVYRHRRCVFAECKVTSR